MQGNSSNLQISHEKNANKRKNPLTPVKLESKNQDKKNNGPAGSNIINTCY